jgi:hypothetical protein
MGCRRMKKTQSFKVLPSRSIRKKAVVTCTFREPSYVQLRTVVGNAVRSELRLIEPPNKLVLRARFAPRGSDLSYAMSRCHLGTPPG